MADGLNKWEYQDPLASRSGRGRIPNPRRYFVRVDCRDEREQLQVMEILRRESIAATAEVEDDDG